MPAFPEGVEHLVCLHPLEPQNLIGHIAKGARCPPMAAHTGVAVLALVKPLVLQLQTPRRRLAVDLLPGDTPDHAAAVAADTWDFQIEPPFLLRRLLGGRFLFCLD